MSTVEAKMQRICNACAIACPGFEGVSIKLSGGHWTVTVENGQSRYASSGATPLEALQQMAKVVNDLASAYQASASGIAQCIKQLQSDLP